ATVSITVNAVFAGNNAPVASDGTLTLEQDTVGSGTLVATDADGDALTYSIVTNAQRGTVTLTNASTGTYDYTPTAGFIGTDRFTFQASDGLSRSNTSTVSITVNKTDAGNGVGGMGLWMLIWLLGLGLLRRYR
ncbi:MAG TPA: Ig-like domain-containing protein, partial [Gammaproteobacteria bacterium]|nr:Ig-like domain-containing protein [Gammaproteobacteria bacterium]